MRKLLLYLSALACCSTNVLAIEGPQSLTTGVVIGGTGFPHFNPQGGKVSADKHYRVIAKTYTIYSGTWFQPQDSTNYTYTGGRGSLFSADRPNYDESILFDDATTYYYNAGTSSYDNRLYRKQSFDNSNNILSLTYSTWRTSTAAWKDSARYMYSYVAGTNKIKESMFQLWVGGTWAHDVPSTLTYDGNKVVDIVSNSYSASYTYDNNDNIICVIDKVAAHGSGVLSYNEKKSYSYNVDGEIATYTLEKWNTTNNDWDKIEKNEYTYTGKNIAENTVYQWNGSNWILYNKHLFTYNSNNDQTTEITQLWNGSSFVNYQKEICAYNYYNLLESITTQNWDLAGYWKNADGNTQIRYYYEYYFTTSVANIAGNSSLNIYPVPATDKINISLNAPAGTNTSFTVQNMNGAVVKQWEADAANTLTTDISSLPAGTYAICARTKDGGVLNDKFVIAR